MAPAIARHRVSVVKLSTRSREFMNYVDVLERFLKQRGERFALLASLADAHRIGTGEQFLPQSEPSSRSAPAPVVPDVGELRSPQAQLPQRHGPDRRDTE